MKVVIVGGGTAGWITSFYLSVQKNFECINISSTEIPIIGVGEGTTGRFTSTFLNPIYNTNVTELICEINGLPKLGILFKNWSQNNFYSPIDGTYTENFFVDYSSYVKPCSKFCFMMDNHKTPYYTETNSDKSVNLKINTDLLPAVHIDAYKTSEYFKKRSVTNGVKYIDSVVEKVKTNKNHIQSIILSNGEEITADLFIDCSGFSRILSKSLENTGWEDYSKYLPVNKAITYSLSDDTEKNEYTVAEAMDYGWTWEIPTRNKTGRGYVYCDKFADNNVIIDELSKRHNEKIDSLKTISFKSGRINKFLNGNCVSIGLSSAFLEPLQATSIHCALVQLELFVYDFISDINLINDHILVENYNRRVAKLYDEMRDFVFVHYTGGKTNSEFWKYVSTIDPPERVKELLHLAKKRLLRSYDFDGLVGSVGQESWNHILFGLSHFNTDTIENVFKSESTTTKSWLNIVEEYKQNILLDIDINLSAKELNDILLSLGKT
jgi:tryptophan 7-halogenase